MNYELEIMKCGFMDYELKNAFTAKRLTAEARL